MSEWYETDVLIIGCGIAGSIAALKLADAGIPVTVVTRAADAEESNTLYAQGGIIYKGEKDAPDILTEDILRAGAGHSFPKAVKILAEEGPALLEKILLKKLSVRFDRSKDGAFSLTTEGGHSVHRILHAKDKTGAVIQEALIQALKKQPNIRLKTGSTAVDLLTPSHHSQNRLAVYQPHSCAGAYIFDQQAEKVVRIIAKKTILATGGLGQIYLRTTNPAWARGDGLAMANRAGARLINCEFIQFHPTTFHYKLAPHLLISEAVRGAGARLVNDRGEPFMEKYDKEWKDLAPRDVVARSIHQEMLLNDIPNVFLDLHSYMKAKQIKEKFPTIYKSCLEYGIDISRESIPVVPGAHYFCGGVWVDEWGRTTIQNLYAVGEVSCTGVHGANRLASASLLEGVVWGFRAAQHISQNMKAFRPYKPDDFPPWQDQGLERPDPALISQDMSSIKNIMWNYVGLARSSHRLARALRELRNLEFEIENFYRVSRLTDSLIGLRNAIRASITVTSAAWVNKRSMGCHFRLS